MEEFKKMKQFVKDVIQKGYNLTPIHCKYCDSTEVTYHQYIGDGYCADCGEWQDEG